MRITSKCEAHSIAEPLAIVWFWLCRPALSRRSLLDVLRNRLGGTPKLIGEVCVPLRQPLLHTTRQGEEFNRALANLERLEVEHA